MKSKNIFVTGIGTDVGKTITSAIITEALQADYWKPIQAGDLDNSDSMKVKKLVENKKSKFFSPMYELNTPASPHFAAAIDGISIEHSKMIRPKTKNYLVIEGAGGLFVPLNDTQTVMDLIMPDDFVIVVSRHYLGSINHSLLTIKALKAAGINHMGIVFSGDAYPSSEDIIMKMTQVPMLGRIDDEPYFDTRVVQEYAELFKPELQRLLNL